VPPGGGRLLRCLLLMRQLQHQCALSSDSTVGSWPFHFSISAAGFEAPAVRACVVSEFCRMRLYRLLPWARITATLHRPLPPRFFSPLPPGGCEFVLGTLGFLNRLGLSP